MGKTPLVSVVIPSWNSESQLKQNLPSVFAAAKQVNAEVVIVDDFSQHDDSAGYLKSLGSKIRFYQNKSNGGFSYTVNRGVKKARGKYIMLLNTDVRPSPDCFKQAIPYFRDPSLYAVTFNSGEAWSGGKWERGMFAHFKVEASSKAMTKTNPSLYASGGQAAFSREKWLELGGMDLLYEPFYWEDVDMGYRAWKRGWQILWAPDCHCVHDHQKSVIAGNFSKEFVIATAQRNQFLFIWKNIHNTKMLLSHLLRLPRLALKIAYLLPILRALRLLPSALQGRGVERHCSTRSDTEILSQWSHLDI